MSIQAFSQTITGITTASGQPAGPVGTLVTISGTGLTGYTAKIGAVNTITISNSGTSLVAMVMPGTALGLNTVTVGTIPASGSFLVTPSSIPTTQQGQLYSPYNAALPNQTSTASAQQGYRVAVSADGNYAIVGGIGDYSGRGAAWIWVRSNGNWTQQAKLQDVNCVGSAQQGCSVAVSADGSVAMVGGLNNNPPPVRPGREQFGFIVEAVLHGALTENYRFQRA